MDGLDEFEKQLAAEKAERERRDDRKKHRHRHHHDDDRHRRRHRDEDDDHRHKRRRRSRDEHRDRDRHRHDRDRTERRRDSDEKPPSTESGTTLVRDAWMTAPSALDIEHVHRPVAKEKTPPREPERVISAREINRGLGHPPEQQQPAEEHVVDYTFGDSGSSWRMTKLRGVHSMAEETGRPVEDVAVERFGSLREFDDAREERQELDRAKSYGKGYAMKEKPSGDLYKERLAAQKPRSPTPPPPRTEAVTTTSAATVVPPPMDQTALNRLRAQMMKAKLRRAPNAAQLQDEYNRAAAAFTAPSASAAQSVVLGGRDSRLLAGSVRNEVRAVDGTRRGRERGTVVANDDMTVDDMLREELRTRGQPGGEGARLAERIAKDAKFDSGLQYLDENAEKLAARVHKSEANLRNTAVHEFQKASAALDKCPLCHHEDTGTPPLAPVLALGTRSFLTLGTEPEVSPGGAVVVPTAHRTNLLECDDDEWEELRNFMKALTRMYAAQGRDVLFYEDAARPRLRRHAALVAVPIPYEEGATAPAHFREAFLAAGEEWAQHKKVVETAGKGRAALSGKLAKEAPYFHVWFGLDRGLAHVVEDEGRWPRGDRFAREVVAGIVGAEPHLARKQGRWQRDDPRVEGFKKEWRKYDWTRVLTDGQ